MARRTFDEYLMLIVKWLLILAGFFFLMIPWQLVWFIVYPIQVAHRYKDANLWYPIEWYMKFIKGGYAPQ